MKVFWFFTASTEIPPAFKMCGIFQACCDSLLGIHAAPVVVKEHPLEDFQPGTFKPPVLEINGRPTQA
ncbi:hypothetical protein BN1723_001252 [Verticillium longisporum]|uniref:Uncharacterized protein n=1 Tax=Verticillium longisporum TaxID=100787 RepID=A0A0G4NKH0_VERLO|nr:hypothetical protein BN1723_001252 [Verticillium longisporum]